MADASEWEANPADAGVGELNQGVSPQAIDTQHSPEEADEQQLTYSIPHGPFQEVTAPGLSNRDAAISPSLPVGGREDAEDGEETEGISPLRIDSGPTPTDGKGWTSAAAVAAALQPVEVECTFGVGDTLDAVLRSVRVDNIPPILDESEVCDVPEALQGMFLLVPTEGSCSGGRVPFSCATYSTLLTALAADSDTSPGRCYPVPLLGYAVEVLVLVAAYLRFFGSPQSVAPSDPPTPFDRPTFRGKCVFENELFARLSADLPLALGLVNAAKFIGCLPLVKLCALSIALRMRGRTPQQIALLFEGVRLPMAP